MISFFAAEAGKTALEIDGRNSPLAKALLTYVNDPNSRNPAPANVGVQVAIAQCQSGNTAAGIPVLEKTLTNARFTLPRRN